MQKGVRPYLSPDDARLPHNRHPERPDQTGEQNEEQNGIVLRKPARQLTPKAAAGCAAAGPTAKDPRLAAQTTRGIKKFSYFCLHTVLGKRDGPHPRPMKYPFFALFAARCLCLLSIVVPLACAGRPAAEEFVTPTAVRERLIPPPQAVA